MLDSLWKARDNLIFPEMKKMPLVSMCCSPDLFPFKPRVLTSALVMANVNKSRKAIKCCPYIPNPKGSVTLYPPSSSDTTVQVFP